MGFTSNRVFAHFGRFSYFPHTKEMSCLNFRGVYGIFVAILQQKMHWVSLAPQNDHGNRLWRDRRSSTRLRTNKYRQSTWNCLFSGCKFFMGAKKFMEGGEWQFDS